MVWDGELKARVGIIVRGEYTVENFDALFLWLRFNHRNRRAVIDVGNFVGHKGRREKGVSWGRAKALFYQLAVHQQRLSRKPIDKDTVIAKMRATAEVEDPAWPRKQLRIGQKKAHKLLEDVISRIDYVTDTEIKLTTPPSDLEKKVVDYYLNVVAWRPVFDDATLLRELTEVLQLEGLLADADVEHFRKCGDYLALYTLSKMHLTELHFEDREPVVLFIAAEPVYPFPRLAIWAWGKNGFDGRISNGFSMFTTQLPVLERWAWEPIPMMLELEGVFRFAVRMDDETGRLNILV